MDSTIRHGTGPGAAITVADPFRPSEYTGMLMHVLKARAHTFELGAGLDMGVGSGVLLATLGLLGVECLYGVDVDADAMQASGRLLRQIGLLDRARLLQGFLWEPVGDRKFDVVVANLPNFAATKPSDPHHSVLWSMGGANARELIDPFLAGLRAHLHDTGVAFMTQNVFAGLAETECILAQSGLSARMILATTIIIHPMKSALLSPEVRASYTGVGINQIGPYEFIDVQVLEIRPTGFA
jgi:release factor glutamine methyltransferase